MKHKLFAVALSLICLASCKQPISGITENDTRIEVNFTQELKSADLENIKETLESKNYQIRYENLAFDSEGKLSELTLNVKCPDGSEGTATGKLDSEFSSIGFYNNLGEDDGFGTFSK